jgi:hypothetical protein
LLYHADETMHNAVIKSTKEKRMKLINQSHGIYYLSVSICHHSQHFMSCGICLPWHSSNLCPNLCICDNKEHIQTVVRWCSCCKRISNFANSTGYNKINWICIQVLKREDTLFLSKIFASWEASYTSDYALRGSLGHFISFPPTHPTIWSWHLKVKSPNFNYWAVP